MEAPMKGDGRARTLVKLLEELPEGICLMRHAEPKHPPMDGDLIDWDDPGTKRWLQDLDEVLRPSQEEPDYDFSNLPDPPPYEPPKLGPVWEVSYYDEYGEHYEETWVTLAEDRDLIRALLVAKNRLRSNRALGRF